MRNFTGAVVRPSIVQVAGVLAVAVVSTASGTPVDVPPNFVAEVVTDGFDRPVTVACAADGRMFVAEQRGVVWVVDPVLGRLETPFIDITPEVHLAVDRGLIGMALDPNFMANRRVYLSYTVDPTYGRPEDSVVAGTGSRVVRYAGTPESNGSVADIDSRMVLIGATLSDGPPTCWPSHSIGALHFGFDGSLFVAAGDGAKYVGADTGGQTPQCFVPGLFPDEEDIGAFRSQSLESLAGKIMRIDPETGAGLPDNPSYDGDPLSKHSRLWVTGLRNPFRFALLPDSPPPGLLFVGDVGHSDTEEITVLTGGDNAGWPCYDGNFVHPLFINEEVPAYDCTTLETPGNPGPLRYPAMTWSHGNPSLSSPPGATCSVIVAGVFADGSSYPQPWEGRLFHANYVGGWVRAAQFDGENHVVDVLPFATGFEWPTDIVLEPGSGHLLVVTLPGAIWRIRHVGAGSNPDLDGNGTVDGADLGLLLNTWGMSGPIGDLDGDGLVGNSDLGLMLAAWTG